MAGCELAKTGRKVCILEARRLPGGRIHTISSALFQGIVELGAEFIHGDLPLTLALLKEAGITYHKMGGEFWRIKNGVFTHEEHFIDHWDDFMKELHKLEKDMTISDFLEAYFSGPQYTELRASVTQYAEGYDTADTKRASSFALREEWQEEDHAPQYRIDKGYGELISYLADMVKQHGGSIHLDSAVKEIKWGKNEVIGTTHDGGQFSAAKIIITVPLSILQPDDTEHDAISFSPALIEQQAAIQKMGIGAVIKILLQFSEPIWQDVSIQERTGNNMKKLGFFFSQEMVPTWWTQYPTESTLLTGWLGGSTAEAMKDKTDAEILDIALASLATILHLKPSFIKEKLLTSYIANWTAEPFIRGSYNYDTIESKAAREVLSSPVADTIYFAGEAIYKGTEMGTVEAALASGKAVASRILHGN